MANSPHLSVLQMVSDYSLDNASKQIPYFDWISQDEEAGRNGSSDQKMIERVIWCQVLAKKEWMLKKRNDDGCFETPTMNGKQGLNEICPWRQNLGEFWRIGPESVTTWPSDHPKNPTNLFTLLQTHFWWDCEFIKSGPICWLIHFIRSTLWTDHSGSVQCAFFIFSGRPQPRSKSWCFTMPSEKALTLPWNGLGGFLLSLLSAKLIMIKIPRREGVRSPKKCGLSGVHAVIMNKQEITFTDWPFDRRNWNTGRKAG